MRAFRARWVFPVDRPPIPGGIVAIDHDRIVSVGKTSAVSADDLGDVAILPGLVNPHTHLEFSDLEQPLGQRGIAFTDWIRLVVRSRREVGATQSSIDRGIDESIRSGVTTLGEIASAPWWSAPIARLEITQFCELIGLRPEAASARAQDAADVLEDRGRWTNTVRPGLSPHAPYTVHLELFKRLVTLASQRGVPLAHHLAESQDELAMLRSGNGPLVDLLKEFDLWNAAGGGRGSRPIDYLQMLADAPRTLVIHGNYLDDEEIGFLAAHRDRMSVIYCPRTHAFFGHDPYPLAKMLAASVNVAIGTDSRASSPDLNPLSELRFAVAQHPSVVPEALLRMITLAAAEALGRNAEVGSLTPGKLADLAILRLPCNGSADPHELLFDPEVIAAATIFRGRLTYGQSNRLTAGNS